MGNVVGTDTLLMKPIIPKEESCMRAAAGGARVVPFAWQCSCRSAMGRSVFQANRDPDTGIQEAQVEQDAQVSEAGWEVAVP